MCLHHIQEQYDNPSNVIISGWKRFVSFPLRFENFKNKGTSEVPLDQWIDAEEKEINTGYSGKNYKTGFHVYEDEEQAKKKSATRRVYIRKVHTKGTEDSVTVLVAQEMYVPSDPNAWPPLPPSQGKLDSKWDKIKKSVKGGTA